MSNRLAYLALVVATLSTVVVSCPALAQPGGGRGFGGRGGGGGGGGGITDLLRSEQVRAELEIVDDQLEDIQSIEREIRDEMRSMFQGMRDMSPEERRERMESMRGEMEEIRASINEQVKDVLLPHQFERLEQIQVQQQVARQGMGGALSGALAEKLGITEEQQEQMAAKARELQAEIQEKTAQLRQEAQDELLGMLTSEQRAKIEEMMGTKFDLPQGRNFGGRGAGGNQRGNRGDRGNRGGGRPQAE